MSGGEGRGTWQCISLWCRRLACTARARAWVACSRDGPHHNEIAAPCPCPCAGQERPPPASYVPPPRGTGWVPGAVVGPAGAAGRGRRRGGWPDAGGPTRLPVAQACVRNSRTACPTCRRRAGAVGDVQVLSDWRRSSLMAPPGGRVRLGQLQRATAHLYWTPRTSRCRHFHFIRLRVHLGPFRRRPSVPHQPAEEPLPCFQLARSNWASPIFRPQRPAPGDGGPGQGCW